MQGPEALLILTPEITWFDVAVIGPVAAKVVTRGPMSPVEGAAGAGVLGALGAGAGGAGVGAAAGAGAGAAEGDGDGDGDATATGTAVTGADVVALLYEQMFS